MERKLLQERKEAIRRQVSTNDVVLHVLIISFNFSCTSNVT
jgi:hypothetical protein